MLISRRRHQQAVGPIVGNRHRPRRIAGRPPLPRRVHRPLDRPRQILGVRVLQGVPPDLHPVGHRALIEQADETVDHADRRTWGAHDQRRSRRIARDADLLGVEGPLQRRAVGTLDRQHQLTHALRLPASGIWAEKFLDGPCRAAAVGVDERVHLDRQLRGSIEPGDARDQRRDRLEVGIVRPHDHRAGVRIGTHRDPPRETRRVVVAGTPDLADRLIDQIRDRSSVGRVGELDDADTQRLGRRLPLKLASELCETTRQSLRPDEHQRVRLRVYGDRHAAGLGILARAIRVRCVGLGLRRAVLHRRESAHDDRVSDATEEATAGPRGKADPVIQPGRVLAARLVRLLIGLLEQVRRVDHLDLDAALFTQDSLQRSRDGSGIGPGPVQPNGPHLPRTRHRRRIELGGEPLDQRELAGRCADDQRVRRRIDPHRRGRAPRPVIGKHRLETVRQIARVRVRQRDDLDDPAPAGPVAPRPIIGIDIKACHDLLGEREHRRRPAHHDRVQTTLRRDTHRRLLIGLPRPSPRHPDVVLQPVIHLTAIALARQNPLNDWCHRLRAREPQEDRPDPDLAGLGRDLIHRLDQFSSPHQPLARRGDHHRITVGLGADARLGLSGRDPCAQGFAQRRRRARRVPLRQPEDTDLDRRVPARLVQRLDQIARHRHQRAGNAHQQAVRALVRLDRRTRDVQPRPLGPPQILRPAARVREHLLHRPRHRPRFRVLERERPHLHKRHRRRPIVELGQQPDRLVRLRLRPDHQHRPRRGLSRDLERTPLHVEGLAHDLRDRLREHRGVRLRGRERQHRPVRRFRGLVQTLDHGLRQRDCLGRPAHDQRVRPPLRLDADLGRRDILPPAVSQPVREQTRVHLLLIQQQALDRPRDLARVRVRQRESLDRGLLRVERLLVERLDQFLDFGKVRPRTGQQQRVAPDRREHRHGTARREFHVRNRPIERLGDLARRRERQRDDPHRRPPHRRRLGIERLNQLRRDFLHFVGPRDDQRVARRVARDLEQLVNEPRRRFVRLPQPRDQQALHQRLQPVGLRKLERVHPQRRRGTIDVPVDFRDHLLDLREDRLRTRHDHRPAPRLGRNRHRRVPRRAQCAAAAELTQRRRHRVEVRPLDLVGPQLDALVHLQLVERLHDLLEPAQPLRRRIDDQRVRHRVRTDAHFLLAPQVRQRPTPVVVRHRGLGVHRVDRLGEFLRPRDLEREDPDLPPLAVERLRVVEFADDLLDLREHLGVGAHDQRVCRSVRLDIHRLELPVLSGTALVVPLKDRRDVPRVRRAQTDDPQGRPLRRLLIIQRPDQRLDDPELRGLRRHHDRVVRLDRLEHRRRASVDPQRLARARHLLEERDHVPRLREPELDQPDLAGRTDLTLKLVDDVHVPIHRLGVRNDLQRVRRFIHRDIHGPRPGDLLDLRVVDRQRPLAHRRRVRVGDRDDPQPALHRDSRQVREDLLDLLERHLIARHDQRVALGLDLDHDIDLLLARLSRARKRPATRQPRQHARDRAKICPLDPVGPQLRDRRHLHPVQRLGQRLQALPPLRRRVDDQAVARRVRRHRDFLGLLQPGHLVAAPIPRHRGFWIQLVHRTRDVRRLRDFQREQERLPSRTVRPLDIQLLDERLDLREQRLVRAHDQRPRRRVGTHLHGLRRPFRRRTAVVLLGQHRRHRVHVRRPHLQQLQRGQFALLDGVQPAHEIHDHPMLRVLGRHQQRIRPLDRLHRRVGNRPRRVHRIRRLQQLHQGHDDRLRLDIAHVHDPRRPRRGGQLLRLPQALVEQPQRLGCSPRDHVAAQLVVFGRDGRRRRVLLIHRRDALRHQVDRPREQALRVVPPDRDHPQLLPGRRLNIELRDQLIDHRELARLRTDHERVELVDRLERRRDVRRPVLGREHGPRQPRQPLREVTGTQHLGGVGPLGRGDRHRARRVAQSTLEPLDRFERPDQRRRPRIRLDDHPHRVLVRPVAEPVEFLRLVHDRAHIPGPRHRHLPDLTLHLGAHIHALDQFRESLDIRGRPAHEQPLPVRCRREPQHLQLPGRQHPPRDRLDRPRARVLERDHPRRRLSAHRRLARRGRVQLAEQRRRLQQQAPLRDHHKLAHRVERDQRRLPALGQPAEQRVELTLRLLGRHRPHLERRELRLPAAQPALGRVDQRDQFLDRLQTNRRAHRDDRVQSLVRLQAQPRDVDLLDLPDFPVLLDDLLEDPLADQPLERLHGLRCLRVLEREDLVLRIDRLHRIDVLDEIPDPRTLRRGLNKNHHVLRLHRRRQSRLLDQGLDLLDDTIRVAVAQRHRDGQILRGISVAQL